MGIHLIITKRSPKTIDMMTLMNTNISDGDNDYPSISTIYITSYVAENRTINKNEINTISVGMIVSNFQVLSAKKKYRKY